MGEVSGLAQTLKEHGPWALTALAFIALGITLRMMREDAKGYIVLIKELMVVTSASTHASHSMVDAAKAIDASIGSLTKSMESLAREQEVELKDIRHVVGNHAQTSEAFVKVIDRQASAVEGLKHTLETIKLFKQGGA